jgi:DNA ligase 1
MLAHPLAAADLAGLDAAAWRAEWKWDGIRVQLVATPAGRRLFSRGADDISAAFPEIVEAMDFHATLDGELLVIRDGRVAPFAELQQRLDRKQVTARLLGDFPVGVRLYDMLFDGTEDLRPLAFDRRRARLEQWHARTRPRRMDLSPLIGFAAMDELAALRQRARAARMAGLMLKRADSPYLAGRPEGMWWKLKRDSLAVDAVLMYAERGSSCSECTFGLWRPAEGGGEELVPVGKAGFGFTDQDRGFLDGWVRQHTVARFGPVREVEKALVLEVAFDDVQASTRRRCGVALRLPRIGRIWLDKPAAEADRLATLVALMENAPGRSDAAARRR